MKVSSLIAAAFIGVVMVTPAVQAQAVSVSPKLKAQLVYLVQEEKLARDAYTTLYAATGVRQFSNISSAEQTHMNLMQGILKTYGIADPTVGLPVGSFKDVTLADLYKKLVASEKKINDRSTRRWCSY